MVSTLIICEILGIKKNLIQFMKGIKEYLSILEWLLHRHHDWNNYQTAMH